MPRRLRRLRKNFDSGSSETVWHRLYVDAHIPAGTSIEIEVRVVNESGFTSHFRSRRFHRAEKAVNSIGQPVSLPAIIAAPVCLSYSYKTIQVQTAISAAALCRSFSP